MVDMGEAVVEYLICAVRHIPVGDIAGYNSRVGAISFKRTAIQSAGGYLSLFYPVVGSYLDRLGTGLTAVIGFMSKAVIKDIPLAVYLYDTAVSGAGHIHAAFFCDAVDTYIAV